MKNNEKLLYEIGELDDIPAVVREKKKISPVAWAAVGSAAAAAAIAGFVILRGTGAGTSWEDCRIYPPFDYKSEVIIEDPPKIPCYIGTKSIIYWNDPYEAERALHKASDIENTADKNPWSEDTELNSLPVFKNKAYQDYLGPVRYFSEERLSEFMENTVKALSLTVMESEFYYDNADTGEKADIPVWLSAKCGGEKYGVDTVSLTFYGDGSISIGFNADSGGGMELPEAYADDTDGRRAEETLSYLADLFKDLLQCENPVLNTYISEENADGSVREYKIYNRTGDNVQDILNYNFAGASFNVYDGELHSISLYNRFCTYDYLGDYPVISAEEARTLLLNGSYIKLFPDSFFKDGRICEEDVKSVELIYLDDEYAIPYYRFYVELGVSPMQPYDADGRPLKLYGDVYVPAVTSENILTEEDETNRILTPDFSGKALSAYPSEEVYFPDGSTEEKGTAVRTYGTVEQPVLEYDFGFLRYAKPVFQSSLDDPDCFDFESYTFKDPVGVNIENPEYFRVKAGDVLENGMEVESANYMVTWKDGEQSFVKSKITLKGEAVYDGILMCRQGEDYAENIYDLVFYADPTGDTRLTGLCCFNYGEELIETMVTDDVAFVTDCGPIFLANISRSDILDGGAKRARVTLTELYYNIVEMSGYNVGYTSAAYTDIELLD